MVIVPATALALYLGDKRDEASPEPDKKVLSILARGFGMSTMHRGSLVAEPCRMNLAVALYQEVRFAVFHICNRLYQQDMEDAECEMKGLSLAQSISALLA